MISPYTTFDNSSVDGKSTLNRIEHAWDTGDRRYHQISANLKKLSNLFVTLFLDAVPPIYSIYRRNLGILHHHRIPFPACIRSSKSSRTARRSTQKSLPCDSR